MLTFPTTQQRLPLFPVERENSSDVMASSLGTEHVRSSCPGEWDEINGRLAEGRRVYFWKSNDTGLLGNRAA